jgi:hypothetical protein
MTENELDHCSTCDEAEWLNRGYVRTPNPLRPGYWICNACIQFTMPVDRLRFFLKKHPSSELAQRIREVHKERLDYIMQDVVRHLPPYRKSATPKKQEQRASNLAQQPPPLSKVGPKPQPCRGCKTPTLNESGFCSRTCRTLSGEKRKNENKKVKQGSKRSKHKRRAWHQKSIDRARSKESSTL